MPFIFDYILKYQRLQNLTIKNHTILVCHQPEGYSIITSVPYGEENGIPGEVYTKKICELTGTKKNKVLAEDIIIDAAYNIYGHSNFGNKKNIVLQSLSEHQPKDAHETRLCAQAAVLYSHGMDYLKRARNVLFDDGTLAKQDWHKIFMKTATKLLDLHTKTVSELIRYKQNGEQRIVVQHVQVNGGNAIVSGMLNEGGGKQ